MTLAWQCYKLISLRIIQLFGKTKSSLYIGRKKQVKVFTSVYWNGLEHQSSDDDLSHTKGSIVIFIDQPISDLLSEEVKKLYIWSDGLSSQFEKKFISNTLPWLCEKHSVNIEWHFFATSHDKGCVDGDRGTIKRHVAQKVIQIKAVLKDAQSFYDCTKEFITPSINTYFTDTKKINDFVSKNVCMLFENAPELKGISSSHYHFVSDGKVLIKCYSSALEALNSNT